MAKKWINGLGILAAVAVLALGLVAFSRPETVFASSVERGGAPGGNGRMGQSAGTTANRSGASITPLSAEEKDALNQAILEEYGALNLYQSVIDQFGAVAPFSQIVRAEQQHVNALVRQATKYGVSVPENPGLSAQPSFDTLSEACQAGVAAEIADADLYDTLKPVVDHTDILQVFDNLQSASLNSHLPAFQSCQ